MTYRVGYPDGWFNRTARAKRHAVVSERFSTLGNRVYARALCGAEVSVSQSEFTDTEADSITCARCAAAVAKVAA